MFRARAATFFQQARRQPIAVGDFVTVRRRFTDADVAAFAKLSGDANPIHVDPAAAKAAGFPACLVHGILVAGLFSHLMGTELPGPQSIYASQTLEFCKPVFVGDEVEARVEVLQFAAKKGLIGLRTTVTNVSRDNVVCIKGRSLGMNKVVTFAGESGWEWERAPT